MARAYSSVFFVLATFVALGVDLGFDPMKEPEKARQMYLAPESFLFDRLRLPDGHALLLAKDFSKPGPLKGAGGLHGSVKGRHATLRIPGSKSVGATTLTFEQGVPASVQRGKARKDLNGKGTTAPRLVYDESPLFECMAERGVSSSNPDGYWQDGRLAFPYENPNQSALLYAGLGILALGLLFVRRRAAAIVGAVLSALCLALLFWTASRGGLLAYFFGAGTVCALRFSWMFRIKAVWIGMAAATVALGAWMAIAPPKLVTRGSGKGAEGWTNRIRLELWQAAPRMMIDAPEGWKISPAGPAYVDWYQPFGSTAYACSLMNDHLTRMVGYGWPLRFGYAFAWLLALSLTGWFAIKTRNAVPFGSWAAIAIAAWFNPVTMGKEAIFVWLPALLATLALVRTRTWLRHLPVAVCIVVSLVGALSSMALIRLHGRAHGQPFPPIGTEGRRVTVGGSNPDTWVVDDGFALGGLMFGRDIRAHYRKNPGSRAIGYVKSVDDLPALGVRRLVLAGRAGDDFLRKACSSAAGPKGLPPELVFLSPPFPPQAIPQVVWTRSSVTLYLGAIARWYSSEYDTLPPWVKVVPGTVRYFPEWMRYAMGEQTQTPNQLL